jgi:hypothetical protein
MFQMRAGAAAPQMRIYESFMKSLCLGCAAWRNWRDLIGLSRTKIGN